VKRRDALKQEPDASAGHLGHLQWAFRGEAVGAESGFVRSARYVASAEPEGAATAETRTKRKSRAKRADAPASKRPARPQQSDGYSGSPSGTEQASELQHEVDQLRCTVDQLQGDITSLKGKIQSWDGTVARMASYQQQHAALAETVQRLQKASGLDAAPTDAGPSSAPTPAASSGASDPPCSTCKQATSHDMAYRGLLGCLTGEGKVDMGQLFTPGGRVKAQSPLKKLVECSSCIDKGALRLIVCTSGGGGQRLNCDWCRCVLSTSTSDASSGW
jgi:hypothetical protein